MANKYYDPTTWKTVDPSRVGEVAGDPNEAGYTNPSSYYDINSLYKNTDDFGQATSGWRVRSDEGFTPTAYRMGDPNTDFLSNYSGATNSYLKSLLDRGYSASDFQDAKNAYGGWDMNSGWWGDQATLRAFGQGFDKLGKDTGWQSQYNSGLEPAQQKAAADAGMAAQDNGGEDWMDVLTGLGLVLSAGGLAGAFGGSLGLPGADVIGSDWASGLSSAMNPGVAADVAGTWGVGQDPSWGVNMRPDQGLQNVITGETGPSVSGNGMTPGGSLGQSSAANGFQNAINNMAGDVGLGTLGSGTAPIGATGSSIAGAAGAEALGTGLAGVGGTTGALAGAPMVSGGAGIMDFIKNLMSPSSGSSGATGGVTLPNGTTSILGALASYLGGSQTADAYKSLQESLLKAGDVSQRPGAQWALGQAQKYISPTGQADYVNGFTNPIMSSYAQHLPGTVAKSGDLTGAMNRSMTDMGAAISGNYNGFINSLLGATGTTQPNAGIASSGQAGATGINQQQNANSALYGTIGNVAGNAINNIFNTPTASGTTYVGP